MRALNTTLVKKIGLSLAFASTMIAAPSAFADTHVTARSRTGQPLSYISASNSDIIAISAGIAI